MSFTHRTPESLLPRSDSKNPTTTCRGTTTNGRPCRRSLASPKSSPATSPRKQGLSPTLQDHNGVLDATLLYCWQHKDQAQNATIDAAISEKQDGVRPAPIQERTSLDSLVARLGVASIADVPQEKQTLQNARTRRSSDRRQNVRPARPAENRTPQGSSYAQSPSIDYKRTSEKLENRQRKRTGFWGSLCCMSSANDDDYYEVVKHKQRVHPSRQGAQETEEISKPVAAYSRPSAPVYPANTRPANSPIIQRPNPAASSASVPLRKPLAELSPRQTNMRTTSTPDTRHLLSFIPHHLSPQTTSALLSELSKPISTHDEEGYIYIFWLTDSTATPSSDTAASLLSPPTTRRQRRPSDVMSEYSHTAPSANNSTPGANHPNAIKLKIGRANNVHRRMNEWNRQCGYNLSLVRYYPYNPSSPSSQQQSPAPSPARSPGLYPDVSPGARRGSEQAARKVRWAARVERLVHIELAEMRVKKDCKQCGREHREWFEVEGTENGVKGVDEVIRRWVGWAETVDKVAP